MIEDNKKLNILLFSSTPPPIGGISSWTLNYIAEQKKVGNIIDLIDIAKKDKSKIWLLAEIKRTLRIFKDTIKKIKNNDYDVIHLNTSCSKNGMIRENIIYSYIKKRIKSKLILHCHCDVSKYIDSGSKYKLFMKLCKKSDNVLVLNKQSYDFVKKMKITNKVYIINNFLDKNNIKMQNKISKNFNSILFVGRYTKTKGIYELIESAKFNKNLDYYFIGSPDNEFDIDNLKSISNIHDLGVMEQKDVYRYMSVFDALILPSYAEGFPMVILEAMFIGIPIITTKVGSIEEMLGKDGAIYTKIADVDSINTALQKIKTREVRENISIRNKKYASLNYSSDTIVKRINEIYLMDRGKNK